MPDHEGNIQPPDIQGADVSPGADDDGGGGWGARFMAKLDLQLGHLADATNAQTSELRKLRREARQAPTNITLPPVVLNYNAGGGVVQNGGTGVCVQIGGPELGSEWSVRQLLVTGNTPTATPAGVAWFLVVAGRPDPLNFDPSSIMDFSKTALPWNEFYSERELYIPPNSNLWMLVTAGTAAAQYLASVTIQQQALLPRASEISS